MQWIDINLATSCKRWPWPKILCLYHNTVNCDFSICTSLLVSHNIPVALQLCL